MAKRKKNSTKGGGRKEAKSNENRNANSNTSKDATNEESATGRKESVKEKGPNLITNYFSLRGKSTAPESQVKVEPSNATLEPLRLEVIMNRKNRLVREEARNTLYSMHQSSSTRGVVATNQSVATTGLNHFRQSLKKAFIFKGVTGAAIRALKDPKTELGIEGFDDVAIDLLNEVTKHNVTPQQFCSLDFANYPGPNALGTADAEDFPTLYPLPAVGESFDVKDLLYNKKAWYMMKILATYFHPQKLAKRHELMCLVMQIDKKESIARFQFHCCSPHGSAIAPWEETDLSEDDRKPSAVEYDSDVAVVDGPKKSDPEVIDLTGDDETETGGGTDGLTLLANASEAVRPPSVAVASRPSLSRTPVEHRTPRLKLSKVNGGSNESYKKSIERAKRNADKARAILNEQAQTQRQRKKDEINFFASKKAEEMEAEDSDYSYVTQPDEYDPEDYDVDCDEEDYDESNVVSQGEEEAPQEEPVEPFDLRVSNYRPLPCNSRSSPSAFYHANDYDSPTI